MAGADEQPALHVEQKFLLTVGIMGATLLQVLDQTIANVALPHMQAALGATLDSVTWVLTSYIIASAIAIPVTGWLSDRVGARPLMLASVTTFIIASMLCGIATSLEEMVAFRLVQGVSGAFISPLAQTIMLDINKRSEHGRAMSIFGMGVMIGPITGPILGGWLTEYFSWRWVFFVNVPVGIACLVLLFFLMPKRPTTRRTFDVTGFAILAVALGSLQLMLDRGEHVDWFNSAEIWIEAGVSLSCFWMFVVHLLTGRSPLYRREMLKDRNLVSGMALITMLGLLTLATMALLPPMLQTLYGYDVLTTGELMASRGVGVLLTMSIAGRMRGADPRLMIGSGFIISAFATWQMTQWSLNMDWHPIVISGFIQGLGLGLIFVPINVLAFATLPADYRTDAATLLNLCRNIGASIGIAMMTSLLSRNRQVSHSDLSQHITSTSQALDPNVTRMLGGTGDTALAMVNAEINRQAAMIAYLNDFKLLFIALLLAVPLLAFMRPPRHHDKDDEELHMIME